MRKTLSQPVPEQRSPTVESRVAIHRHPLHPVAVVYPIACLTLLLPADVAFLWTGDAFWADVAWWLNLIGLVTGLLAATLGIADMFLIRVARRHVSAWSHFIAAVMLLALAAVGVWLRYPAPAAAGWWALVQSAPTAGMVLVAGWLGGTLSFGHGIGVYGYRDREDGSSSDRALEE